MVNDSKHLRLDLLGSSWTLSRPSTLCTGLYYCVSWKRSAYLEILSRLRGLDGMVHRIALGGGHYGQCMGLTGVPEGDPLSAVAMWAFSHLFDSVVSARSDPSLTTFQLPTRIHFPTGHLSLPDSPPLKTNIAPETQGLEDEFRIGKTFWEVSC